MERGNKVLPSEEESDTSSIMLWDNRDSSWGRRKENPSLYLPITAQDCSVLVEIQTLYLYFLVKEAGMLCLSNIYLNQFFSINSKPNTLVFHSTSEPFIRQQQEKYFNFTCSHSAYLFLIVNTSLLLNMISFLIQVTQ